MDADARTQPPGWYQDPERAESLRYWDGRTWTEDRRDKPEWMEGRAGSKAATGFTAPPRWSTKKVFGLVVAVGVLLCLFVWLTIPKRPGRTVEDREFLRSAAAICSATLPDLRAERRPERRLSDSEVADRIDQIALKLDDMVDDLDALPVAGADQAQVHRWIRAWDGYVAVGRQYADTIRSGDAAAAEEVRAQADDEADLLGSFASGNRIDACIPYSLN